ncbi:serine/threonine protein kinase [Psychromicrobium silvestre]|uniref:non-specific serine/threonine protein kinase n=1 Tax=Psychromicrobium silvestre TaxID=1645614 RepID=A0A7Y9LSD7_9MICC|nr:serine/threonine-protein kinase [Psychromicrobium silvestre]NYE94718.1 serine/threonine protein kinase [Psychromicrobium silvestre]
MDRVLCERYRLIRRIGVGAAAAVFRAEDLKLSRQVAVKIFSADVTDVQRQEQELRALAKLQHPFLISLFDCGVCDSDLDGPRAFMVMELIEGSDLRELLVAPEASGGLAAPRVAKLGWALAQALLAVHSAGVVHRDVKPANILLGRSELPILCDFGIARLHDSAEATSPGLTIGTASYLSPEQALGEPVHSSADIYSLGLVLLECLSGDKAFPGSALESSIARLLHDPAIPQELEGYWPELLTAMTARNPSERPQAAECAEALFELQIRQAAHAG